jgi:hypothetical protein
MTHYTSPFYCKTSLLFLIHLDFFPALPRGRGSSLARSPADFLLLVLNLDLFAHEPRGLSHRKAVYICINQYIERRNREKTKKWKTQRKTPYLFLSFLGHSPEELQVDRQLTNPSRKKKATQFRQVDQPGADDWPALLCDCQDTASWGGGQKKTKKQGASSVSVRGCSGFLVFPPLPSNINVLQEIGDYLQSMYCLSGHFRIVPGD